jgi:hypothetical protein
MAAWTRDDRQASYFDCSFRFCCSSDLAALPPFGDHGVAAEKAVVRITSPPRLTSRFEHERKQLWGLDGNRGVQLTPLRQLYRP